MLNKILFNFKNKTQLYIAFAGGILGFVFLITSIHYLIKVGEFGKGAEILGKNTLIVQKKVSTYSSMGVAKVNFSEQELNALIKKKFITKVDPILNNTFGVSLQTDSDMVPYFRTDVYVQSINPSFLKIDTNVWQWQPGDEFVPIVLPRDFLVMLNTFASARGIPQVSEDLAKSIDFKFTLFNAGKQKKEWEKARIVGFTSEVSSLLVPKSFMTYGNQEFAIEEDEKSAKVTQILVEIEEGKFGDFEKLMKKHGLETKESALIVGKLKSVAGTLFSVVMVISIITVVLATLLLLQYAQLIMTKNEYQIKTLLHIGYSPEKLIRDVTRYFIKVFMWICFVSISLFIAIKFLGDYLLTKGGITISSGFTWLSFFSVFLAMVVFIFLNHQNAKKEILKHYS